MMTALDAAIARIHAANDDLTAKMARIDADWMVMRLTAICEANTSDITGHGKAGFDQMVARSFSAAAVRKARAGILLRARRSKLFNGCNIGKRLSEAAEKRVTEIARRYVEISDANLARIDANITRIAAVSVAPARAVGEFA